MTTQPPEAPGPVAIGTWLPSLAPDSPNDTDTPPRWYALIDVASTDLALAGWAQMLNVTESTFVNLYDDMDGLELKQQGPRLAELPGGTPAPPAIALPQNALESVSFLATRASTGTLTQHLQMLREAEMPDGSAALFRFQDTRVLAALAASLPASSRGPLLGPVLCWCCQDVCGTVHRLDNATPAAGRPVRLTPALADAIDEQLMPHELLAQTREADAAALFRLSACERGCVKTP